VEIDLHFVRSWPGGYWRCSGSPCIDHLPVCWRLHQGSSFLDLLGVPVQPQRSQWLVVAAGGLLCISFFLCWPVLYTAAPVVQTGGC
jgi:hypothetical protein